MTTMEYADFIKLGFNKNEAIVYMSLIKFGKAEASLIIKDTKFHKNIVYDNLEKLLDKGLVTYIIKNGKKVFQIVSSSMLVNLFEEREKAEREKKEFAEKVSKEIDQIAKKIPFIQEATIYKGIKGIKSFYNEVIEIGEDFFVFGAPQQSVDIMGDIFWKNFEIKRREKNIKAKMIFNPSLNKYGKTLISNYTEIRYFERDFEPLTETHVQKDLVAIIVWIEEPILFLIRDKFVANSYKDFFEKMWRQAKKEG